MSLVEDFARKIAGRGLSVVLPEGHDERIVQAARQIKDRGIGRPILLGKPEQIEEAVRKAGVSLKDIPTIDPKGSGKLDAFADLAGNAEVKQRYLGI